MNVFEDSNCKQVWQNAVPGYEVIQMLEEVQKVKDIQSGLLLKLESLNAQYKRLTQGVQDKYIFRKFGVADYNRREQGTQTGQDGK